MILVKDSELYIFIFYCAVRNMSSLYLKFSRRWCSFLSFATYVLHLTSLAALESWDLNDDSLHADKKDKMLNYADENVREASK